MPGTITSQLSDAQIDDLVAWLESRNDMRNARVVGALLLWAAGAACEGGNGNPGDGGTGDGLPPAPACAWNMQAPVLELPTSQVRGVLRGQSRNASTTCTRQKGAGGPEAIFLLRVTERSLIELEAISTIDTVIAVRRACDDPLTELACNDAPASSGGGGFEGGVMPPFPVPATRPPPDAAPAPDASTPVADAGASDGATLAQFLDPSARDAHVRVVLDPGSYYVLLDEAEPFGVGGEFVLKVSTATPPAQTSCTTAQVIQDGTSLPSEELDLGTELAPACGGGDKRPALFYRASIPSGQRLTVRALANGGDRPWSPVLQLLSACSQGMCLGTDQATPDGIQRMLRHVNHGPSALPVLLSVGANTAVVGGTVRLDVSVAEPVQNGTCAGARPLSDGLVLRNQDPSEGQISSFSSCETSGTPSLFYSATLLPEQRLQVMVSRDPLIGRAGALLTFRESCNNHSCRGPGDLVEYTNTSASTRTVIVEASGFGGVGPSVFDLVVSMPPPPARLAITPTRGLQTSETGGQASFTVALTSPPLQPIAMPLQSGDPAEGTVSPAQLMFDASNWQTPQTVTVTGVDDSNRDGARAYQVRVGPAIGDDRFSKLPAAEVALLNRDDEPGFFLDLRTPLATTESGGKSTFTVVLDRAPTAAVRLPLRSSDEGEGTVSPAELVFDPQSWSQPQTVTVTGADDQEEDGGQMYRVLTDPAVSEDPQYAGIDAEDLDARNADDELVRVAAQVVSGNLQCYQSGTTETTSRIALDDHGNLYVAMLCFSSGMGGSGGSGGFGGSGGSTGAGGAGGSSGVGGSGGSSSAPRPPTPTVFVARSQDGGRTFGAPVDTGIGGYMGAIAGGPPGVVLVAGVGPLGLAVQVTRSADGGTTWQAPTVLVSGGLRLAAAGRTAVLGTAGSLWISQDAGESWTRAPAMLAPMAVGVDAGTGAIWAAGGDGSGIFGFWESHDGGASFRTPISLGSFLDVVVATPSTIFATGNMAHILAVARDNSTRREVEGLGWLRIYPRTLVADAQDNLVVLQAADAYNVLAHRLPAGAEAFQSPRTIGVSQDAPSAVALSDKAIAVALQANGQVMVAVEVWP